MKYVEVMESAELTAGGGADGIALHRSIWWFVQTTSGCCWLYSQSQADHIDEHVHFSHVRLSYKSYFSANKQYFLSHNKSVNSTFSYVFSDKRTGLLLAANSNKDTLQRQLSSDLHISIFF
jgi:hypothetical protein